MTDPDAEGSSVESFESAIEQALANVPAVANFERFSVDFFVERGGIVPGTRYVVSLRREPPTP